MVQLLDAVLLVKVVTLLHELDTIKLVVYHGTGYQLLVVVHVIQTLVSSQKDRMITVGGAFCEEPAMVCPKLTDPGVHGIVDPGHEKALFTVPVPVIPSESTADRGSSPA